MDKVDAQTARADTKNDLFQPGGALKERRIIERFEKEEETHSNYNQVQAIIGDKKVIKGPCIVYGKRMGDKLGEEQRPHHNQQNR